MIIAEAIVLFSVSKAMAAEGATASHPPTSTRVREVQ